MKTIKTISVLSLLAACFQASANEAPNFSFPGDWLGEYPKMVYFTPAYNAGYWNTGNNHQFYNNCYNYAANRTSPTNAKSQPGFASGHLGFRSDNGRSCYGVIQGAKSDGFVEVPRSQWASKKADTTGDKTLMALVLAPQRDYHWYRRDSQGKWSHKPGSTAATNLDNSGNIIHDPQSANRGIYDTFCGYFEGQSQYLMHRPEIFITQNRGNIRVTGVVPSRSSLSDNIQSLDQPQSTVTLLKYSGRENPSLPISQLNDYLKHRLSEVAALQNTSIIRKEVSLAGEPLLPGKLGYSGILINDTEGVYFKPGDKVLISNEQIKILSKLNTQTNSHITSTQGSDKTSGFTKSSLLDISLEQDLKDFIETK
ncbi:hypothetical protein [Pseudoalteromonas luteoviolacea]|uniref:Uncharacterized protein n=1 Tax=Pseudoalteromonas luteoviolacea S4054 TaxID=1129367 RepID=A0A0F6AB32_9GAMM|nr:hypothetical protein [Pseudoalteromonas luteoviolacea]AOT06879.1 hypothetical protein S4054249_02855 [Pseudoalteromonas luteoviolacea]AOT11797.1 hypothetical protein S40542_02855 [Pseudoalteromonas luteoviolacea]AOT16709.1 hypothetical protein S4054_02855 [Pseudoalteromonas luteoviolacea]KKE83375.1 hypothetical protein N479_14630 [Pseudoalteromonas luteoviolacea S4054]KZN74008.1 hypothetical protein N481_09855 [Pseudoalteromonas luteoviolacea S4047-1]